MMKRLFVAIKVPPQQKLLNAYYHLKKEFIHEKIKWVDIENMHFTLKFVGNTHASDLQKLIDPLDKIAQNTEAFKLEVESLGVFGSRYNPRVIRAGIKKSEPLLEFGESILSKLDESGFERDRQNFVPHITLGRIKYLRDKNHLSKIMNHYQSVFFQSDHIKSFYLYESILQKEGPHYKVVKSFNLQP